MTNLTIGALAVVLTFGSPTAANAAVSADVDGTSWSIAEGSQFGLSGVGAQGQAPHGAYGLDSAGLRTQIASTATYDSFRCLSNNQATESDNDFILDCLSGDNDAVADLAWTGNVKIFSGPYQGLVARLQYTVTNSSGSSKTLDFQYQVNDEECDLGIGNLSTSSGDPIATTSDYWLTCGNDNQANESSAWGNNFASTISFNGSSTSSGFWQFNNESVTLAAGESKNYVFFYYTVGSTTRGSSFGLTDAEAVVKADDFFNLCNLEDSRLWEGISAADNWDFSEAINCGSNEDGGSEGLANTGAEASALNGLVAVGLAALVTAVAVRRRSARH